MKKKLSNIELMSLIIIIFLLLIIVLLLKHNSNEFSIVEGRVVQVYEPTNGIIVGVTEILEASEIQPQIGEELYIHNLDKKYERGDTIIFTYEEKEINILKVKKPTFE
ncbi:MAG: hypothetical protein ACOCXG_02810 [Nanoarchaeota archaeon]